MASLGSYLLCFSSHHQQSASNPKFKWPSLLTLEAAFYRLLLLTFLLHAQDQSLQSLHAQDQCRLFNIDIYLKFVTVKLDYFNLCSFTSGWLVISCPSKLRVVLCHCFYPLVHVCTTNCNYFLQVAKSGQTQITKDTLKKIFLIIPSNIIDPILFNQLTMCPFHR